MLRFFHPKTHSRNQSDIHLYSLPVLPHQVSLNDVDDNGMLLSPHQVKKVKKSILKKIAKDNLPDHTRFKKSSKCPYSILKSEDQFFAIYKGDKWEKHLGRGRFGKVKLIQNIDTGAWYAYKIQIHEGKQPIDDFQTNINVEYGHVKSLNLGCIPAHERNIKRVDLFGKTVDIYQYNYAMKYTPGISLENYKSRKFNSRSTSFWLAIAIQMLKHLQTLFYIYRIVHCDLKPANFIYDEIKNQLHIVDWGLAVSLPDNAASVSCSERGTPIFCDIEQRESYALRIKNNELNKPSSRMQTYNIQTEMYAVATTIADITLLLQSTKRIEQFDPKSNYIYQPGNFLFSNNSRISNPNIRLELVTLLNGMTNLAKDKRPSLNHAISELCDMHNVIKRNEPPKIIFMMHALDLIEMDINERYRFMQTLSQHDQLLKVYLLDADNLKNPLLFKLRREFEDAKIPLSNEILRHPSKAYLVTHASLIIQHNEKMTCQSYAEVDENNVICQHIHLQTAQEDIASAAAAPGKKFVRFE